MMTDEECLKLADQIDAVVLELRKDAAQLRIVLMEAKEELEKPKRGWHGSPMLTCMCFACKAQAKIKEALVVLGKMEGNESA